MRTGAAEGKDKLQAELWEGTETFLNGFATGETVTQNPAPRYLGRSKLSVSVPQLPHFSCIVKGFSHLKPHRRGLIN